MTALVTVAQPRRRAATLVADRPPGDRQTIPAGAEEIEGPAVLAHVLGRNIGPLAGAPLRGPAPSRAGASGPGPFAGEYRLPGTPGLGRHRNHQATVEPGARV